MSRRPSVRTIRTQLTSLVWELPDGTVFTVRTPSADMLNQIDREWPAGRRDDDQHLGWKWREIFSWSPEAFCLVDANGAAAGIWSSLKTSPIALREGSFYRLDRIEASPLYRGGIVGVFLFSLVAVRALELKANGIVLGALPASTKFYERLGGENRLPAGWNNDRELVPFVFPEQILLELKEDVDELIKQ